MNILLLGSGGREHAFAWKISQSKRCEKLFIAPGNAGTLQCGTNVNLNLLDFVAVRNFVLEKKIDMVIVGPEEPLVKGIHDFFLADEQLRNIPVIGPEKDGAQLEGSKDFSKQFMSRHRIPTARYQTFTAETLQEGFNFLEQLNPPYVLKADGLAAGKGVVIPNTLDDAKNELKEMLTDAKFGAASSKVVIEEFLKGIELSVFVLTDGDSYKILPEAKDYKRIGDQDTGPNTGGMGAVSPVPFAGKEFMQKVEERIIIPTIEGLKKENILYKGFIFIGLMNVNGEPYVIEYNVRMGDPETEAVIPRIESDLVELFEAVSKGTLAEKELVISKQSVVTVMLVSGGYPGDYEKGKVISGLGDVKESFVFHAGTSMDEKEVIKTSGGRVLAVSSFGKNMEEAAALSYRSVSKIAFENMYFRKDISLDLQTKSQVIK
ncbi:MAG: phosphoribosylamine--glycine ligase [Bacteroidetes bacterium]|nr:phosphoribosylamine--glycine ligase [Bacteroidota bacterium]